MKYTMLSVGVLFALASSTTAQWSDNFDSYANNTALQNVGGWFGWDNAPAAAGSVTTAFARSAPHSILVGPAADAVRPGLGATSGRWVLTGYQYIPSTGLTNHTWLIVNNRYNHNGPYAWSCQFRCNFTTKKVEDRQAGGRRTAPLDIVFDQWVQWRLEIDIDNNTIAAFYNKQLLSEGTYVTSATNPRAIENIDLFSQGATCYWDDLSLDSTKWTDNFDSYTANAQLQNLGGWFGWDNLPAAAGSVSTAFARSAPHSILVGPAADAVQPGLGATSGRWVLRGWQYIPAAGLTNHTWLIVNNRYNHNGPYAWSCQFRCNFTTKKIEDRQAAGRRANTLDIIFDQWVEWRLDIDLDRNYIAAYYGGSLISEGTYVTSATNPKEIQNIDLFSQGATCYWDDISLHQATDTYGIAVAQGTGTRTTTLWVNEPAAANSLSAILVSTQNTTPYQITPLVDGWVHLFNPTMILLGFTPTDAAGRGALTATLPNLAPGFEAWTQTFSAAGAQLIASDPLAVAAGNDGTSSALGVYNDNSGRFSVAYDGPASIVVTHQPSNTVLGESGQGGVTGLKFLRSGDSIVVTQKVTNKVLTTINKK